MNAETIRILIAKGLTAQDILDVAETLEAPKVRSSAAIRQANYRERKKADTEACDVTSDVTRDASQCDIAPPNSPPNDIYSNPPLNPPTKSKSARGCRLPDDWFPKPLPADLAATVAAWPAGKQERELARFRDWAASATGPNAVKKCWDAAYRNWLRKADDDQGKPSHGRQSGNGNSTANAAQRALAIIEGRSG